MRLLVANTFELVEYIGTPPQYAILSHTWEDEEVTYQDMCLGLESASRKHGWPKIEQACLRALENDLDHIWIDTCCIDKTNSVELSEAINSMYQWYRDAELCITYLADFDATKAASPDDTSSKYEIFECRWWQRGWTLQELIAPHQLQFYDSVWKYWGSKQHWEALIATQTGIDLQVLRGDKLPHTVPVAQVFSWAADRRTTRIEDEAYCLLGLFDVNMPLLYGEGTKAFRRLQEEIVKHKNDLTIFAHNSSTLTGRLFAEKAADFKGTRFVHPFKTDAIDFSITNRGLRMSGDMPLRCGSITIGDTQESAHFMFLGYDSKNGMDGAICLNKIGPRLYCRDDSLPLAGLGRNDLTLRADFILHSADYYILTDVESFSEVLRKSFTTFATHLVPNDLVTVEDLVPHVLFDHKRQIFMVARTQSQAKSDMVIAVQYLIQIGDQGTTTQCIVLCDRRHNIPQVFIFRKHQHPQLAALLFAEIYRENSVPWVLLRMQYPQIHDLNQNTVFYSRKDGWYDIDVSLESIGASESHTSTSLFGLKVHVKKDEARS